MSKLAPLVYTERQLDELGILSRMTRWRLRREGKFPQTRAVGGRRLYDAQEIHDWWRRQEMTTGEQGTPK